MVSSGPWFLLWKRKRSAITKGFGAKWSPRTLSIASNVMVDGFVGDVRLFSKPYVWLPMSASRDGTRAFAFTPFAKKNCSTRST